MKKPILLLIIAFSSLTTIAGTKNCVIATNNHIAQQYFSQKGYKVQDFKKGSHIAVYLDKREFDFQENCNSSGCDYSFSGEVILDMFDGEDIMLYSKKTGEYNKEVKVVGNEVLGPDFDKMSLKLVKKAERKLRWSKAKCI